MIAVVGSGLFVNYVRSARRDSPINLAVVRAVLGTYLVWKTLSLDWGAIDEWPAPVYQLHEPFLFPDVAVPLLPLEKWVLVAALVAFAVGYRTRLSSFTSALVMTHMAGLRLPYNPSGGTEAFFLASYFVLIFGLYSDQDYLSVDRFRRTATAATEELDSFLRSDESRQYRTTALRWCLLALAILYFGAGLQKLLTNPGLAWTAPDNLARYVTYNSFADHDYRVVGEFLTADPALLTGAAWGTLVLELGLLVGAVAGASITPLVVGLIGLHVGIGLALDPFFFDFIVFLCLFGAYDSFLARLSWSRPIDVIYDSRSHRSLRILSLLKRVDVNGALSFYPHSEAPEVYRRQVDDESPATVSVVVDREVYHGYRAFHELFAQCRLFVPLVFALRLRASRTHESN